MISDTKASLLIAEELHTLGQQITGTISKITLQDSYLKQLLDAVIAEVQIMEPALDREKKNNHTKLIQKLDHERDESFISLRDFARSFVNSKKQPIREAGEHLVEVIEKRGNDLHSLEFEAQTEVMNALLEDLNKPESKKAIETLGGDMWLEELTETHKAFEDTYQANLTDEIKKDYPLLHDTQARLTRHLLVLIENMKILDELNSGKYPGMIKEIEETISDVMGTVRKRLLDEGKGDILRRYM